MTILLDECVPRPLKKFLTGHSVLTAQQAGLGGYKNGQLLTAAEGQFDLLITTDKNLRYQQHLATRKIGILLLSTNRRTVIEQNGDAILRAVNLIKDRQFLELEIG
jgi:hypothetical protein